MKTLLSNSILESLINKTIKWEAPIYERNTGFYGKGKDGGICIIKAVDTTQCRPIIESETLEGRSPQFIFNENEKMPSIRETAPLCFSDGDRYVSFEIIDDEN